MKISRYLLLPVLLLAVMIGGSLGTFTATNASASAESSSAFGRRLKDYGVHVPFGASIATTSTTDAYFQVPKSGRVVAIYFGSLAALATDDTNYVTFSITNLGQAGAGSTALLAATDANTTKTTGGTALAASSKRTLTLSTTATNLDVVEGDTIRIRATASGTLAGAVTVPRVTFLIAASGQ